MAYSLSDRLVSTQYITIALTMVLSILWINVGFSDAHGGKKHANSEFTPLQALQKAVTAYDKLIVSGKLEESWETGLQNVEVVTREKNGKMEYRVTFQRNEGTPNAVYIFYSENGEYTGSNFDGK